jgi:hypothetical protein
MTLIPNTIFITCTSIISYTTNLKPRQSEIQNVHNLSSLPGTFSKPNCHFTAVIILWS